MVKRKKNLHLYNFEIEDILTTYERINIVIYTNYFYQLHLTTYMIIIGRQYNKS